MKGSNLKVTLAASLILISGFLSGIQAQPGRGGNRGYGRPVAGRMLGDGPGRDSSFAKFKLTEEQKNKIGSLRESHQAQMKEMREKMKQSQRDFKTSVGKVLTPEQFRFWQARQHRQMMMQGHRAMGMKAFGHEGMRQRGPGFHEGRGNMHRRGGPGMREKQHGNHRGQQ